jgi:hypothetical protein
LRIEKASLVSARVKLIGEIKAQQRAEQGQALEDRMLNAEKRHGEHIRTIRGKAGNENAKVSEVKFLNNLNDQLVAEELQRRLAEVEARTLAAWQRKQEMLLDIASKHQRRTAKKSQQMSALRLQVEQQKMERWERLQTRLSSVQARREARLVEIQRRSEEDRDRERCDNSTTSSAVTTPARSYSNSNSAATAAAAAAAIVSPAPAPPAQTQTQTQIRANAGDAELQILEEAISANRRELAVTRAAAAAASAAAGNSSAAKVFPVTSFVTGGNSTSTFTNGTTSTDLVDAGPAAPHLSVQTATEQPAKWRSSLFGVPTAPGAVNDPARPTASTASGFKEAFAQLAAARRKPACAKARATCRNRHMPPSSSSVSGDEGVPPAVLAAVAAGKPGQPSLELRGKCGALLLHMLYTLGLVSGAEVEGSSSSSSSAAAVTSTMAVKKLRRAFDEHGDSKALFRQNRGGGVKKLTAAGVAAVFETVMQVNMTDKHAADTFKGGGGVVLLQVLFDSECGLLADEALLLEATRFAGGAALTKATDLAALCCAEATTSSPLSSDESEGSTNNSNSNSSSSRVGVIITPNTPIRGVTITPGSSSSSSSSSVFASHCYALGLSLVDLTSVLLYHTGLFFRHVSDARAQADAESGLAEAPPSWMNRTVSTASDSKLGGGGGMSVSSSSSSSDDDAGNGANSSSPGDNKENQGSSPAGGGNSSPTSPLSSAKKSPHKPPLGILAGGDAGSVEKEANNASPSVSSSLSTSQALGGNYNPPGDNNNSQTAAAVGEAGCATWVSQDCAAVPGLLSALAGLFAVLPAEAACAPAQAELLWYAYSSDYAKTLAHTLRALQAMGEDACADPFFSSLIAGTTELLVRMACYLRSEPMASVVETVSQLSADSGRGIAGGRHPQAKMMRSLLRLGEVPVSLLALLDAILSTAITRTNNNASARGDAETSNSNSKWKLLTEAEMAAASDTVRALLALGGADISLVQRYSDDQQCALIVSLGHLLKCALAEDEEEPRPSNPAVSVSTPYCLAKGSGHTVAQILALLGLLCLRNKDMQLKVAKAVRGGAPAVTENGVARAMGESTTAGLSSLGAQAEPLLVTLCQSMPMRYFTDDKFKSQLLPTLAAMCLDAPEALTLLRNTISLELLSTHMARLSRDLHDLQRGVLLDVNSPALLHQVSARFPTELWPEAVALMG